jgi:hypothetical protein
MRIFKYTFEQSNRLSLLLPRDATPLSFQWQQSTAAFQLYVLTDPLSADLVTRHFRYFVTGHEEIGGDAFRFIDTAQALDGQFVAHCFEVDG